MIILALILMLIDLGTSLKAIEYEINPLAKWIFAKFGKIGFVVFKGLVMAGYLYLAPSVPVWELAAINVVLFAVVVNNLKVLYERNYTNKT
jgi:hypothetical protein